MGASSSAGPPDQVARPRRPRTSRATETLYFAYGSNLHIAQMAERCPGSSFKGKATLAGWRWQINKRGVANVIRVDPKDSSSCAVEGLVFSVTPKDLRSLDRSEGVSRGFYQKHFTRVFLEPHARFYNMKTTSLAETPFQQTGLAGSQSTEAASLPEENGFWSGEKSLIDRSGDTVMSSTAEDDRQKREQQTMPARETKVLVYVSEDYAEDGPIREEYIARMGKAVVDAAALGVSQAFLDKYIAPHLVEPAQTVSATSQEVTRSKMKTTSIDDVSASKLLDRHQGPKPEALGNRPFDFEPASVHGLASSHQVALHTLQLENREPAPDIRIPEFHKEMLERLEQSRIGHGAIRKDRAVFIVAMKKMYKTKGGSSFEIKATSHDLDLANELAMKAVRDAFSDSSPRSTGQEETGANGVGLEEEVRNSRVKWMLNETGCLDLTGDDPITRFQVKVWVEMQDLLVAV
ncbi:hypothetical protein CTRI78_v006385 [Colletotrichum trifolii]|uniref:gamma-glutamylcyclotransferase n=1 Tax=Colletotrichum trifolii TaxID=5466 RepID=A0A4R8RNQ3_COLTR|nr:hypothetical protein CTRI78_v006385 [Colletotrichum trifolii]